MAPVGVADEVGGVECDDDFLLPPLRTSASTFSHRPAAWEGEDVVRWLGVECRPGGRCLPVDTVQRGRRIRRTGSSLR